MRYLEGLLGRPRGVNSHVQVHCRFTPRDVFDRRWFASSHSAGLRFPVWRVSRDILWWRTVFATHASVSTKMILLKTKVLFHLNATGPKL